MAYDGLHWLLGTFDPGRRRPGGFMIGSMTSSTTGRMSTSSRPTAQPVPFAAATVEASRIVVPLDGSPFAERALAVAKWAATALGAHVHLVEVAASDEDAEGAIRYLDSVARHNGVTSWDVLQGTDVGSVLAGTVAGSRDGTMCMATHGRDRSASLLGSVAASLLDRSDRPALVVGPHARPVRAADAAVVVALDGTARDKVLLPVALGWAARLARRLLIATVAEPAPPSYRKPERTPRSHGPADPERYLAALATRASGADVTVATEVIYDPTSVRDGLVPLLGREAALVVLGSRHRHGVPRMVLGSHAARIVHDTPVPALVVPFTSGS